MIESGAGPESPSSGATGRGARLRAAREALHLSREDMAARLRLSVRQIQALEEDEEAALPPAPFVRGFVRNYARAVGRDASEFDPAPDHAVEPLPDAHPPLLTPPQPQHQVLLESGRASANRLWLGAALLVLVLGALGSWVRTEHLRSAGDLLARTAQPSLDQLGQLVGNHTEAPAAAPAPAPVAAPASAGPPAAGAAPADSVEPIPASVAPVAAAPAPAAAPVPAAAAPVTAGSGAGSKLATTLALPPVGSGPSRKLQLDFDADCWVEVRDENNQVLLSGVSRAGDHRDLEAHGPVRIVVGNAPAAHLSWNGRAIDLSEYTKVTVARLTLDPSNDSP